MSVLHIVPDHALGGGAVIVARLLEAAAGAEAQVALLPSNAEPRLRALFAPLPHRFARFDGRGSVAQMARALAAEAGPDDLVHAHGTRAALAATLVGAMRPRLRVVYTVHGFHGLARPDRLGLRVRLERWLARRVQATAFVSAADAAVARSHGLRYRGPAEVIENGLPAPAAPPDGPRDIDLLFVGRLVPQKWPEAFVDAVAQVPGAPRTLMIGAGALAPAIDALAAAHGLARFERVDGLDHPGVLDRMARSRVLVMTSRWEGLPTVAIEALLSGCLVVGHDIPPLAEVLGDQAPALLTPPDAAALARRMDAALGDEAGRARLAATLSEAVRVRHDPARMARRYAALYRAARDGGAMTRSAA